MDITSTHLVQLLIGLSLGVLLIAGAYILPEKLIVGFLILLIPFQIVSTRYGSLNVLMTFAITLGLILKGSLQRIPLRNAFIFVLLSFLISTAMAPRAEIFDHLNYSLVFASNFLLFWICYNLVQDHIKSREVFSLILIINVFVLLYCFFQNVLGLGSHAFMDIDELTMISVKYKTLLNGPFQAVGITAEYFLIQIFICMYLILHETRKWPRLFFLALMFVDFTALVATGNRGGFLSLIFGIVVFCTVFRKEILQFVPMISGLTIVIGFILISLLVVKLTHFNLLYEKLFGIELISGIPDNRYRNWTLSWQEIKKRPFLGHGPRFRLLAERTDEKFRQTRSRKLSLLIREGKRQNAAYEPVPYPHNLYLFILYTTGLLGLLAYGTVFAGIWFRLRRGWKLKIDDTFLGNMPKLGVIILLVILIDQVKVSLLRFDLNDYQQYIFMLFGTITGLCNVLSERKDHL